MGCWMLAPSVICGRECELHQAAIEKAAFQDLRLITSGPGEVEDHQLDVTALPKRRALKKRLAVDLLGASDAVSQFQAPTRTRRRGRKRGRTVRLRLWSLDHDHLDRALLVGLKAELQVLAGIAPNA